MPKIAIVDKLHPNGIKLLEENPNFQYEIIEDTSKENLISKLPAFDGITLRRGKIDKDILVKCKNLKVISRHGVGYDNVDINYLKEKKITLLVTGTTTSISPAEHIMFMILSISKGKDMFDNTVRNGEWRNKSIMQMQNNKNFELCQKTLLIVGFVRTGKQLIKRCLGFEMKVYVYDPFINQKIIQSFGGIKINDTLVENDNLIVSPKLFENKDFMKISYGKKKHYIIKML